MRYQIVCSIPLRMLSIRRLVEFLNRQIVAPKTINFVRKLGTGSIPETVRSTQESITAVRSAWAIPRSFFAAEIVLIQPKHVCFEAISPEKIKVALWQ